MLEVGTVSPIRSLGQWVKIIGKVPSIIPQELTVQLATRGISQHESDILASSAAEGAWNLPFLSTLPPISPALDPKANPLRLCSLSSVRRGKNLQGAESSHKMIAPLHPFGPYLISSNSPWGPFRAGSSGQYVPLQREAEEQQAKER